MRTWRVAESGSGREILEALVHGSHAGSAHERLPFDFQRFLIAPLSAQRVGEQPPRLSLSGAIAAGRAQCLAPATLCLMQVALRKAQSPEFYP